MDQKAMAPQGLALLAYDEGDLNAELVIHRDDGFDERMPVSHFFRSPSEFTNLEIEALDLCSGRILDIGAGTGLHSLVLQQRGLAVTSIDLSPQAAEVMRGRGVRDVHCADIFDFQMGPFETLLMLGHGLGMVETIAGLDQFLVRAHELTTKNGQLLVDSQDVRRTDNANHLAYQDANQRSGRYIGEIRLQLAFHGQRGPLCGWLHVDAETLGRRAESAGWKCKPILQEGSGHYLARLTRP